MKLHLPLRRRAALSAAMATFALLPINTPLAAAEAGTPLFWNVGSGTWNSDAGNAIWGTVGDDVSADTPYAPYAQVTIFGSEGGTITLSGTQTASSLTVAHSGYTLTRGGNADSLTVEGDLTVKENVSATLAFLPSVVGEMAVQSGAVLDFTAVGGSAVLAAVLAKGTGAGTIRVQGAGMVTADYTLRTQVEAVGDVWLGGPANAARTVEIPAGASLAVSGSLTAASSAELKVSGGLLTAAGGLVLGHESAAQIYKGTLRMSAGEVRAPFIRFSREDTANIVDISGGTLQVTGATAFETPGARSSVAIAGATLTNGSTDMAFNHAATYTDAVIEARGDTTVTLGGAGLTSVVVNTLTTRGKVKIDGRTALSGAVSLNSGGELRVAQLDAAEATLTTTGAGTTVLESGAVGHLVVQGATTAGTLAVQDVSGTGVLAQQGGTALQLKDGGTMGGSVTLGQVAVQGEFAKVGTGTVTTGDITGADSALTVAAGALAVGGNLSGVSRVAVESGAALSVAGDADVVSLALGGVAATPALRFGSLSAAALAVDVPIAVLHEYFDGVAENSVTIAELGTPTAAALSLLNTQGGGYDYGIAADALGHIVISRTATGEVWVGAEGAEWEQGSSWDGGFVPGLHANVSFVGKGTPLVRIAGKRVSVGSVFVTGSESAPADYTFSGGALSAADLLVENGRLSIADTAMFHTGHVAETGALTVPAGGALSVGELESHGALSVAGALELGSGEIRQIAGAAGAYGQLTVQESLTVAEEAAVGALTLGAGSTLRVLGTLELHGAAAAEAGSTLESAVLDMRDPSAAATLANLQAGHITLGGVERLRVTELLTDTAVTLEADLRGYAPGEYTLIDSATGRADLDNLAELNAALLPQGRKLVPLADRTGLVVQMLDYRYAVQLGRTETGRAGLGMADAAAAAGVDPAGDLAAVLARLDALREAGTTAAQEEGDRLGAALSGVSAAAMGAALSGDAERQLKAIRNRTSGMGVNQAVVNENMPYLNAWVNAEGDYRELSADGSRPGYTLGLWGGTVGFDVDCTPCFTCGLAATAMYGDVDTDDAEGELDTYYLSAFAFYERHRWTHALVAAAGLADTSLDRRVGGARVRGDSDGYLLGCLYELGYVFALNEEATAILQPVVNLAYSHAALKGYTEKGSDLALRVGDVSQNRLVGSLGARVQSAFGENVYNRRSLLEARALLKLVGGDRRGKVSTALVRYPGAATTKSAAFGVLGGEFGAGVIVPLGAEGGSLFMDASAEIRADWVNVNGTVGYRMNF